MPDYNKMKLEGCAAAAVADNGPKEGTLTHSQREATKYTPATEQFASTADHQTLIVSIEPHGNNPPDIRIDATSNNTQVQVDAPNAEKIGEARLGSPTTFVVRNERITITPTNQADAAVVKGVAEDTQQQIKSCMAGPGADPKRISAFRNVP